MHRIRRIIQIQGKFAYSFMLLGVGLGVTIIILFVIFSNRVSDVNLRAEAFPTGAKFATNQIIVKYKTGLSPSELNENEQALFTQKLTDIGVISQNRLFTSDNPLLENYYILNLPPDSNIPDVYGKLVDISEIDAVTPDYILSVQEEPDDPAYPSLWGLQNIVASGAWDIKSGNSNVIVGVVDTGVDLEHEDLKGNVIQGINTVNNTNDPTDDHGHGTHVAGTVGAVTNNGIGISSISWGTKIMAIKSCDENGDCKTSDVSRGIQYAVDNGAKVVNISVAGEGSCNGTYNDVISYTREKGVLLVVAAGNGINGKGVDAGKWIPASCKDIFTVGALGPSDTRAGYSNYGKVLSVSAPGGDRGDSACTEESCILSTSNNNSYSLRQGTSMAAPQVSGTAALLLSYNPSLSINQLKSCITQGSDKLTSDKFVGNRLNTEKALTRCTPIATPTPIQEVEDTGDLSISGIVYVDENNNKMYDSSEKSFVGAQVLLSGFGSESALSNSTGRYIFPNLDAGFYTLSLVVGSESAGGIYDVSLQALFPNVQINLPLSSSSVPSPTQSLGPEPTQKTSSIQCVLDPACESSGESIQICTLKCE